MKGCPNLTLCVQYLDVYYTTFPTDHRIIRVLGNGNFAAFTLHNVLTSSSIYRSGTRGHPHGNDLSSDLVVFGYELGGSGCSCGLSMVVYDGALY